MPEQHPSETAQFITNAAWPDGPPTEVFSAEEEAFLSNFVTNLHGPVFALRNLPEVVKGALFARYSRSRKSLRRLLLDEFRADLNGVALSPDSGSPTRAGALYSRVFAEYGDDSIAQLGAVHVACEGVSNIVSKIIERGRLMSYLEQSTRYIPYTDKPNSRWKYHTPSELTASGRAEFDRVMNLTFADYAHLLGEVEQHLLATLPPPQDTTTAAFRSAVRAKSLDVVRGSLPASTRSNIGVFGSGQSYELLVMRLHASANQEAKTIGDQLLFELQNVIPDFVARVPREDRGVAWTRYLEQTGEVTETSTQALTASVSPDPVPEVSLVDYDPEGEKKVVAAILYSASNLPEQQLLRLVDDMSMEDRARILREYVGARSNRRHRPGRAFERTSYRFDILGDYGAFRDLQRHRLLSLDWQTLTTKHGYNTPDILEAASLQEKWHSVMSRCADLHQSIAAEHGGGVAAYAVPMAYRIRYFMDMNAREAMHVIELRSSEQGHENYRRVAIEMHRLIAEQAGHHAIAAAMEFVSHSETTLERLRSEASAERRRKV